MVDLLTQVKAVAVQPVAVGILRGTAHAAKQASGERFQTFAAKVRGLTTDCNYVLPCLHAAPTERACNVANCVGVNYTSKVVKDILLSGIHNPDVRREVLGTSGVEEKSVHEIIRIVEGKEAARDAASNARPATAAAATSSYKKASEAEDPKDPNRHPASATGQRLLESRRDAAQESPRVACQNRRWGRLANPRPRLLRRARFW